ncbi:MAG: hypothetical protein RR275_09310 [Lachnospiraceae bacterium]
MKFSQYTWSLYKQSPNGQKAIKEFEDANKEMTEYDLFLKYNPYSAQFFSEQNFTETCDLVWLAAFEEKKKLTCIEEAKGFYSNLILSGIYDNEGEYIINEGEYDLMLSANDMLSFLLYYFSSEYFIPNLFRCRFFDLNKITDAFEIDLPPIPKKSDYKARCMYYWSLCEIFYNFRIENELSPTELCAFLYDFAPNYISKAKTEIPQPAQAWFIGGKTDPKEAVLDFTFWQANPETKKGDILIHYETSPISAITCIWIAQTDGVVDPFFHYYSNAYISNKIDIPHITLKELQADEYFSKHPLIRKKFQGVNGWSISSEDYTELLRMVKEKGFNTEILPKLYAPALQKNISITIERDVELQLLEPILNSMGWNEGKDFICQLHIHAGRGHRVFPDYALHYNNKPDYEQANVLIEAKLYMRNNQDIEEAFKQARSYANILESTVIVLCDKVSLIVYEKRNSFDRDIYKKYYWGELDNPDVFNELKNKLNI